MGREAVFMKVLPTLRAKLSLTEASITHKSILGTTHEAQVQLAKARIRGLLPLLSQQWLSGSLSHLAHSRPKTPLQQTRPLSRTAGADVDFLF